MMVSLKTVYGAFVWMFSWFYVWPDVCCMFGQIRLYFGPVFNISWNHCRRIMGGATDKNRGSKSEINFVGLTNQGATCYLNTLLQTWFMTREVKDCINRSQTQDRLIYELKNLFEQLESENDHAVCTKRLTSYLELYGNCSVHKQCDIEVCFRSLMSKLSTKMDKENNILKIYQVTMVHSMKCSKCKIPLDKENLFLDIPLSMCSATSFVKFKCMEESLQEFLIEETMEGDNKCYCDICEEKTESTSRYYFKKLPQILTFQLKRFEFDCYCMQYRKIEDCINLPSDLVFNKSQDDYNEWRPVNKEHLGLNKRCYDALEGGQGSFSTQQLQNGTSKDSCGGRTSEEAQDQSEQDSTEQNLKKQKMLNMESNAQYNHSLEAMKRGQSEISPLQGQNEYSVNGEGRMTEAAPGQSEQDTTEDKESNAQYNDSFKGMERGQSEILPLQGQEEYSVNAERRMTEAAPGQSEQDSTEDKKRDMEHREISVDNIDVQGQLKIKEEVSTSVKVDESPGQPGIYPRLPREESNAQYNDSFKAMEQTQSEISSPQGQEEYSVNAEGRMTEAAPVQSEQDSTEDKEKKYELFAIWHHRGSYGGGHYIAEIKSGSGDWYSFDDRFVKKIGKNINLRSTTAYMVMYRLVDTNKETGSDATTLEQCQAQNPYPEYQNGNEQAENYFYI